MPIPSARGPSGGGHVGDVGVGGGEAGGGQAVQDARPKNSHQMLGAKAMIRKSTASPKTEMSITGRRPNRSGQRAQHRSPKELHAVPQVTREQHHGPDSAARAVSPADERLRAGCGSTGIIRPNEDRRSSPPLAKMNPNAACRPPERSGARRSAGLQFSFGRGRAHAPGAPCRTASSGCHHSAWRCKQEGLVGERGWRHGWRARCPSRCAPTSPGSRRRPISKRTSTSVSWSGVAPPPGCAS